ncbi:tetratricopeptide repeat protein [Saccharomonospora halophila]|uniref:XRE family transcriptional regulator n=1 Tax=Saccharomonospora halophila TaxID=129922 RepID=UPI0003A8B392|nr:XRE family transcriptional regulator [Saccharomonospora halophila]
MATSDQHGTKYQPTRKPRTALDHQIRDVRQETLQEFAEYAERFPHDHGEPGTLSVRHLDRLVNGRGLHGKPLGKPRPATARLLERIFGIPIDVLLSPPVPEEDRTPVDGHAPCLRLDDAYVETLHSRIAELVDLDLYLGGDHFSDVALELFRSVHRKLGANRCEPAIERDLYAAAGELGEVAGWLLYDAGEHDLVRRINHEALHLSRLAGDHSMELLILHNMSMHAGHLGRPSEALRIARMVLETNTLSPRLEALFRTREARALALDGDDTAAERTFRQARSLYLDGVRDEDPAWAWWINDQELAWHEAVIRSNSGEWCSAADTFFASIQVSPRREVRRRYNHLASLLDAQIRVGAWRDVDQTIERVMPYVDEVGSTRTATTLLGALDQLDATRGNLLCTRERCTASKLVDRGRIQPLTDTGYDERAHAKWSREM